MKFEFTDEFKGWYEDELILEGQERVARGLRHIVRDGPIFHSLIAPASRNRSTYIRASCESNTTDVPIECSMPSIPVV